MRQIRKGKFSNVLLAVFLLSLLGGCGYTGSKPTQKNPDTTATPTANEIVGKEPTIGSDLDELKEQLKNVQKTISFDDFAYDNFTKNLTIFDTKFNDFFKKIIPKMKINLKLNLRKLKVY